MKLTARKTLTYGGKKYQAGQQFLATERDGKLLVLLKKAALVATRKREVEPELTPEGIKPVRQYKRRDMKAE